MYDQDAAFAGLKATAEQDRVETFAAGGDVPFGRIVTEASGVVSAGGSGTIRGGSVHTHCTKENDHYVKTEAVGCLLEGKLWVETDGTTVTVDGAVKYDPASGKVSDAGGTSGVAVPGAVFRQVESDLAVVQFNYPIA